MTINKTETKELRKVKNSNGEEFIIENLDVKPLSIARFFYEKGVEDIAIIQRLIYLVYCEILEKEKLILFKEEWQAWSGGAVVESVFYRMRGHSDRKELFKQIPSTNKKLVIDYCENLSNHYQEYVKVNEEYEFLQKACNMPWEIARYGLSNDLEKNKIKTIDIINFANKENKKLKKMMKTL